MEVTDKFANLLDKMTSSDPNVRSMATADLITQLKASPKLNEEIEKKIIEILLNLLEDQVAEVQKQAVKGLGLLVKRVKPDQMLYIVEILCKNLTCEKDQLRHISNIGLTTVITYLPKATPELTFVWYKIIGNLTDAIQQKADVPVQLEVLDTLSELLSRFGNQLTNFYTSIQEMLLPLLEKSKAVCGSAITALAHLLTICELELFNETTNILLDRLTQHSQGDFARMSPYIQCISAISCRCGQRFGDHLERIVPFLVQLSEQKDDDELNEYCIQAFEAFLRKTPKEITPYVPQITRICLTYLCHGEANGEFDNKRTVLLEASKCIELLLSPRCCMKSGILKESLTDQLRSKMPNIIETLDQQLKKESVEMHQEWFSFLGEMINVVPSCLIDHLDIVVPGILYTLKEKNADSNIRVDTLIFLGLLIRKCPPKIFHPHMDNLIPVVIQLVDDSSNKISSEALAVLKQLIKVIPSPNSQFAKYIEPIYKCTFIKLKDPNLEVKERAIICIGQLINTFGDAIQEHNLQEALSLLVELLNENLVRLSSIQALILIASSQFKINLKPYLGTVISILGGLRQNLCTRTINSLVLIDTLVLFDTLVEHYGDDIDSTMIQMVLVGIPPINDTDPHVSKLTLTLLTSLINSGKASIITDKIIDETLVLVRSGLWEGSTLKSLLDFYQALVVSQFPSFKIDQLLKSLMTPIYENETSELASRGYNTISKCVSAIAITDQQRAIRTVARLMEVITKFTKEEYIQMIAMRTIGEIGKTVNLSSIPKLKELLINELDSQNKELQLEAAFALGLISVGNMNAFLPVVIDQIKKSDRKQYLLHSLKEIIICHLINDTMSQRLAPYLESIWTLLIDSCQCSEEDTRKVAAECLGKLIGWNPDELLPRLKSYLENEAENSRSVNRLAHSTVVTAMKFVITERPHPIDRQLKQRLNEVLRTAENEESIQFTTEELELISSGKWSSSCSLLRDADETVALGQLLGAVAAAPNYRRRENFRKHLESLAKANSGNEEFDSMLESAFEKSVADYGLTHSVLEANTSRYDAEKEEFEQSILNELEECIEMEIAQGERN